MNSDCKAPPKIYDEDEERERNEKEREWSEAVKKKNLSHSQKHGLSEKALGRKLNELPPTRQKICSSDSEKIVACLRDNGFSIASCFDEFQQFNSCVDAACADYVSAANQKHKK